MSGLPAHRLPDTPERNPSFDGERFITLWAHYAGSAHRHFRTGELVLCYSMHCRNPRRLQALRRKLFSHPGNIGSLLDVIDERDENAIFVAIDRRAQVSQ